MATERIDSEIDIRPGSKGKKDEDDQNLRRSSAEGDEQDDIEIEIKDDTPEADRGRTPRAPGTKSSIPEDEEIGQYTKGVQDRLKQMKWEYHEERRNKEAWQREHSAAVDLTKKVLEENKKLRELVTTGHKTLIDSTKTAAETEMATLQDSLKVALETGDTGKAAELQGKLARAAARAEAQTHIQPVSFPKGDEDDEGDKGQQRGQRQERQQEFRVSDSMQDWMRENPWFNQDKRMTAFAFGVHEELIDKKIPLESPRYFQEINKAVKDAFPNYFEEGGDEQEDRGDKNRRSQNTNGRSERNGAPARRNTVSGVTRAPAGRQGGKVTLTASQVALAKRLGITEQQYAREMLRLENDNG